MTELLSDNEDTVNLNDVLLRMPLFAGSGTTGTKLVVPGRDFVADWREAGRPMVDKYRLLALTVAELFLLKGILLQ